MVEAWCGHEKLLLHIEAFELLMAKCLKEFLDLKMSYTFFFDEEKILNCSKFANHSCDK